MPTTGDDGRASLQQSRAGEFAQVYRGIEGFYLVNRKGQLGYVRKIDGVPVRETFDRPRIAAGGPGEPDREPFDEHLAAFEQSVAYLLELYRTTALWRSMELGYVLPAGEGGYYWSSASLIVHHEVVARFRAHEDAQVRAGVIDPFKQAETSECLRAERSIHHGMDDLLHLSDERGRYVFMPMFYYRGPEKPPVPEAESRDDGMPASEVHMPRSAGLDQPLRAVDLVWRPTVSERALPGGGRVDESRLVDPYSPVLDVLRQNLLGRGAIDRAKRVENRFSIT